MKEVRGDSSYNKFVGELLKRYNSFEEKINDLISDYYSPSKNIEEFKKIVLNSSILGMGQKAKILANMTDFDRKQIEKLRKLMSIRNGIAHNNAFVSIKVFENENDEIQRIVTNNAILVMNSSGEIKAKDFDEEYREFENLMSDISTYINVYRSNHGL